MYTCIRVGCPADESHPGGHRGHRGGGPRTDQLLALSLLQTGDLGQVRGALVRCSEAAEGSSSSSEEEEGDIEDGVCYEHLSHDGKHTEYKISGQNKDERVCM